MGVPVGHSRFLLFGKQGELRGRSLKRFAQYVATGLAASGAKLEHDDFLTGYGQEAAGAIDRQTGRSAAAA
jgi:hypothetical protein